MPPLRNKRILSGRVFKKYRYQRTAKMSGDCNDSIISQLATIMEEVSLSSSSKLDDNNNDRKADDDHCSDGGGNSFAQQIFEKKCSADFDDDDDAELMDIEWDESSSSSDSSDDLYVTGRSVEFDEMEFRIGLQRNLTTITAATATSSPIEFPSLREGSRGQGRSSLYRSAEFEDCLPFLSSSFMSTSPELSAPLSEEEVRRNRLYELELMSQSAKRQLEVAEANRRWRQSLMLEEEEEEEEAEAVQFCSTSSQDSGVCSADSNCSQVRETFCLNDCFIDLFLCFFRN